MVRRERGWRALLLLVSGLLTAIFLVAGAAKLAGGDEFVKGFAQFGFPKWFLYFTGAMEVVSAALLWVPRLRWLGALGIVAVMIGAVLTHLTHGQARMAPIPLALGILAGLVAWGRRGEVRALLGREPHPQGARA
jgi:uncharacterized membrane protein YphA (DoxX/SURF4 family)